MTASAPYLSFNTTFTPACMGRHAGGDTSALTSAPGKTKREMQLVYYVGVARGTTILVDFGKHRKILAHVLSGVLSHVPSHVARYSLGYGRTVALFLLSEGYTFFSVADEALGRERGFQTLTQVRAAFVDCLGGNASSTASSLNASFETETTCSSTGRGKDWAISQDSKAGRKGSADDSEVTNPMLLRRPSIPRSRSASQLTSLMSEAMESRFEQIVSKCKGRPLPKRKLECYPDAPKAYLTSKKSVYEPDLLEDDTAKCVDEGFPPPAVGEVSARESLLSEIADMLKEVDSPRVRSARAGGAEEEEEEDEHIPGMDLLMGMVSGGDKWFSVAGSAAWNAPGRDKPTTYSTANFQKHREIEEKPKAVRPGSGVLQAVTIFDDAEGEAAALAAAGEGSLRVQKTASAAVEGTGASGEAGDGNPAGSRAKQRLKMGMGGARKAQLGAGRRVPTLRGALNSVFNRSAAGNRLSSASFNQNSDTAALAANNSSNRDPTAEQSASTGPAAAAGQPPRPSAESHINRVNAMWDDDPSLAHVRAPARSIGHTPLRHEGRASGRLAPLLQTFMRRVDGDLGGGGSHSRTWRIPGSQSRKGDMGADPNQH